MIKLDQHVAMAGSEPGAQAEHILIAQNQLVNGMNYHLLADIFAHGNSHICSIGNARKPSR